MEVVVSDRQKRGDKLWAAGLVKSGGRGVVGKEEEEKKKQ